MSDLEGHHKQIEAELQKLIDDYRTDIEEIQNAGLEHFMTESHRSGYVEGLATVCNALEDLLHESVEPTHSEQCDADGPGDLICTRHQTDHDAHVTYRQVNGQLQRIEWFACDTNGEPITDNNAQT